MPIGYLKGVNMHRSNVLKILKEEPNPVHILKFETKLDLKERTIREAIRNLKDDGLNHGFNVLTIPKQGYALDIEDNEKFDDYLNNFNIENPTSKLKREVRIIFILLQQRSYITIQKLTELLDVSRNTINSDLKQVEQVLLENNLSLTSKAHYGVKIEGNEYSLRNAFYKFVVNSPEYTKGTENYFEFISQFDDEALKHEISKYLKEFEISVSSDSFNSIIEHIKIFIYRTNSQNYIKVLHEGHIEIHETYFDVADKIIKWIENTYNIKIPKTESLYLASQISGRTLIKDIPKEPELELESKITSALAIVDAEFLTEFKDDEKLKKALLMHLYPLMVRIAYKVQLKNPLIDTVSSRYASVFLVAIRFTELMNENAHVEVSEDELGYIALHFAGHLERKKVENLNAIRNILLISEIERGNVLINRHKLETIFINSSVEIRSPNDTMNQEIEHADIILSTTELKEDIEGKIVLKIPEILTDEELITIRDVALIKSMHNTQGKSGDIIGPLFDERFFKVIEDGDYLQEIEKMSQRMVDEGVADPSFTEMVLERESRFSTIYNGGIAGPHSLYLNAIEQALGVIIIRRNMNHLDKDVHLILLINIHQGNLFLYREISRLIMAIMNDVNNILEVKKCNTYEEFINWLEAIKY